MKQLKRCNERCGCKTYTGFPRRTKEINRFKEKLIIAMIDKKKGDVKYDFSLLFASMSGERES